LQDRHPAVRGRPVPSAFSLIARRTVRTRVNPDSVIAVHASCQTQTRVRRNHARFQCGRRAADHIIVRGQTQHHFSERADRHRVFQAFGFIGSYTPAGRSGHCAAMCAIVFQRGHQSVGQISRIGIAVQIGPANWRCRGSSSSVSRHPERRGRLGRGHGILFRRGRAGHNSKAGRVQHS